MKSLAPLGLCLGIICGFFAPTVGAKDKGLDILISADASPSPESFRPKPGQPIYYLLFQSRETLGEIVAGVKLPEPAVVERAVVAELEKQGFIRAREGGPIPTIAIFAVVGDSNFKDEIPQGNPWNDDNFRVYLEAVNVRSTMSQFGHFGARPDTPLTVQEIFQDGAEPLLRGTFEQEELRDAIVNEARRLRNLDPARKRNVIKTLVGARKVDQAVSSQALSSSSAERIAWTAFDNELYISLSALEAKRRPDGGRAFLWRTTMLVDWREDFSRVLPAMLAQAGPVFGTDVPVPGFVNTAKPSEGKVEIGEFKVLPQSDPATERAGLSPKK